MPSRSEPSARNRRTLAPVASSSLPYRTTSLLLNVSVCASGSNFIALVRMSRSTLFSAKKSSPPSRISARDFSPPRKPLLTAVRSYGGSGSRETTSTEPSAPSSRSVRAAEKPASPPPTMTKSYSDTLELGLSLLREGGEALGRVGGVEQPGDALALARQRVADRQLDPRVGRRLDLGDRGGRAAGQRLGVGAGLLRRLGRREQAVEDAEAVRLAGRDRAAGDHQVQRPG